MITVEDGGDLDLGDHEDEEEETRRFGSLRDGASLHSRALGRRDGAAEGSRYRVRCDACLVEAPVVDATDLPLDWAASLVGGRVVHACPDCPVPPLPARGWARGSWT